MITIKRFDQNDFTPVLYCLWFPKNARENNIVNPKMVVKFTILVPYRETISQSFETQVCVWQYWFLNKFFWPMHWICPHLDVKTIYIKLQSPLLIIIWNYSKKHNTLCCKVIKSCGHTVNSILSVDTLLWFPQIWWTLDKLWISLILRTSCCDFYNFLEISTCSAVNVHFLRGIRKSFPRTRKTTRTTTAKPRGQKGFVNLDKAHIYFISS